MADHRDESLRPSGPKPPHGRRERDYFRTLLERVTRALFVAMLLDAHDDPVVRVDREVALPSSWVETYVFLADLDDPPFVFVLTEEAARLVCSVYG
jgi:hypothetical protein